MYDPLDGSSNIDVNVSIGTIFSIHRKISDGRARHPGGLSSDGLGRQVAAGYVLYGSSTMLVYTSGAGVHGFTLDPSIGEFLLSHPRHDDARPAEEGLLGQRGVLSPHWSPGSSARVVQLKGEGGFGSRYIGSFVSDFHRTLLRGGLFMYPPERDKPEGKLRLMYEAAPMAMIVEQAGGRASTGSGDIMAIEPESLHERVPVYIGSSEFVDLAERMLAESHDGG